MSSIAPFAEWTAVLTRLHTQAPEAFSSTKSALNLIEGEWSHSGFGRHYESPIDGRSLGHLPMIDLETARRAVRFAKHESTSWANVDLDERRRKVTDCLEEMRKQRELIALLLIWEIGKPYAQALTDIDRCISGVEWYIENIEAARFTEANRSDLKYRFMELSVVGIDALCFSAGAGGKLVDFKDTV